MTIGVDCRLSGLKHAGIGRYISNLINRFPKIGASSKWVFFFISQEQANEVLGEKIAGNTKVIIAPIRHYSLKEQFVLPRIFNAEKLDLLYVPHFNVPIFYFGKIVITIHDLLWHEQRGSSVTTLKSWVYWIKYFAYLLIVTFATIKAEQIFVPSNFVKNVLKKFYPWTDSKTTVCLEGVDNSYQNYLLTNETKNKKTKQLVYTGSLYPHKNLPLVLNSLKKLPDYSLIIVGSRNIFQEKTMALIEKLAIKTQVSFAGYLSDIELIKLYQKSSALVVPSLSEGFGLPGVEAMAVGLPVLASDIPIFKEIYQDSAVYFDPNSIDSFIRAVADLENLPLNIHIKKAKALSKKYNWDDTAKNIYDGFVQTLQK